MCEIRNLHTCIHIKSQNSILLFVEHGLINLTWMRLSLFFKFLMIITSYLRYMLLQMHVRSICTLNSLASSESIFFENIIIISINYSYETALSFCNIYERSYVKSVHNKRTHCIQIPKQGVFIVSLSSKVRYIFGI